MPSLDMDVDIFSDLITASKLQTGLPDDYSRLIFPVNVVLFFVASSLTHLHHVIV